MEKEGTSSSIISFSRSEFENNLSKMYIPGTYEDYLQWKGLETWPEPILSEKPFGFQADDIFGTEEDILNDLRTIDTRSLFKELEGFENKLQEFEKRLQPLVSGTFADDTLDIVEKNPPQRPTQTEKLVAKYRAQLGERQAAGLSLVPNFLKQLDEIEKQDAALRKYLIEQCIVPEFNPAEFPDLPGHYDAPYLLQVVGNAQHFQDDAYFQVWRKMIISEAAIGVLQDLFWWVLIDRFYHSLKADDHARMSMLRDKSLFFNRLADSFVALFESINPETRDEILKAYPNFMAQCLYVTFFEAFPDSARFSFREDFKQYLLDACYELFNGLHAPTNAYAKWPLEAAFKRLKVKSSPGQADLNSDASGLSSYLQAELQLPPLHEPIQDSYSSISTRQRSRAHTSRRQQEPESHPIGAAERFRNVIFNTHGKSPLMERYIQIHKELAEESGKQGKAHDAPQAGGRQKIAGSLYVRHPRVDKASDVLALTYQDVIRTSKSEFKTSKRNLQKAHAALDADLKIVDELKRETLARIKHLEKELMEKKYNPNAIREIRLRTELIIAKEPKMAEKLEDYHLRSGANDNTGLSNAKSDDDS